MGFSPERNGDNFALTYIMVLQFGSLLIPRLASKCIIVRLKLGKLKPIVQSKQRCFGWWTKKNRLRKIHEKHFESLIHIIWCIWGTCVTDGSGWKIVLFKAITSRQRSRHTPALVSINKTCQSRKHPHLCGQRDVLRVREGVFCGNRTHNIAQRNAVARLWAWTCIAIAGVVGATAIVSCTVSYRLDDFPHIAHADYVFVYRIHSVCVCVCVLNAMRINAMHMPNQLYVLFVRVVGSIELTRRRRHTLAHTIGISKVALATTGHYETYITHKTCHTFDHSHCQLAS